MRLAFVNVKGYQSQQVDSPFFKAADNRRWMLGLNNKVYGPFETKDEAVAALQNDLLILQGVR